MPYKLVQLDKLVVLRWEVRTPLEELRAVRQAVPMRADAHPDEKAFIVVVDKDCLAPDGAAKELLGEMMVEAFPRFRKAALVIEGVGLISELKRTFIRAMSLLSRVRPPIYGTIPEALAGAIGQTPEEVATTLSELRSRGIPC